MDEEEDTYCRFGTALEPLAEDEVPSKKPIAIEDQIVTDANGKRRFHGAFTGGFSAGFWNTVGSLEGWKPQNFKSSRNEKAGKLSQRVVDFMDDEDLGEFGIAPQRVQTTADFTRQEEASTSADKIRKRKLQQQNVGPIPGVPVLHQLLQPAKDNIAIRLLKKMGWKEGQGVGARQTRKEKKLAAKRNARERYIMKKYGCDMGPIQGEPKKDSEPSDEESDLSDDEITFAPDDFEPFVCVIKTNTFGIGYQGLSRDPVLQKQQHINLFGNAFEVMGKDNKKLSIRGQAFGVGALEEEDEDIYAKDDLTRYDFTLGAEKRAKRKEKDKTKIEQGVLDGFMLSENISLYTKKIFTVTTPAGYKPRNWAVRKSRFEPIDQERAALIRKEDEYKAKGLGRHDLDPDQRGKILGETSTSATNSNLTETKTEPEKPKKKNYLERINEKYRNQEKIAVGPSLLEKLTANINNFTKAEILNEDQTISPLEDATRKENEKVLADAKNITKLLDKTPGAFKPFILDDTKQQRYEKFVEQNLKTEGESLKFLATIQPLSMSEWDREMEMKEFVQAKNIYRPLKGLMSDRFVSESTIKVEETVVVEPSKPVDKVIKIVRTKTMWKPSSQLCKRFNIAEPFGGSMVDDRKEVRKPKFSVFDYLEMSVNRKDNFVTPVIIPSKAEKPKPIISQTDAENTKAMDAVALNNRLSTKELFNKEMKASKIEWGRVAEAKPGASTAKATTASTAKRVSDKHKTPLEKKVEEMKNKHPSEKKDLFKAIFDTDSEPEEDNAKADPNPKVEQISTLDAAKILGTEAHKDIFASTKQSAAEINVLRNTSPPRGIFANLFVKKPAQQTEEPVVIPTAKVADVIETDEVKSEKPAIVEKSEKRLNNSETKIIFKPKSERNAPANVEDVYGPQMPNKIPINTSSASTTEALIVDQSKTKDIEDLDTKLLKLLKKSKSSGKIVEEWVEKPSDADDKKKKRSKKEKDKKKKSKKHKKEKKRHKDK